MVQIRVGDGVYELSEPSSDELARRLASASPPLQEGGEPPPGSIQETLHDAVGSGEPPRLDDGQVALIGVVVEAWALEVDGDLPADVQDLRHAIAAHLG
jgi:hypothetical protein